MRQEVKWTAPSELPSLAGIKRLSIDCETYDPQLLTLGPGVRRGGYIVGIAVGADDRRWYFPVRHEGGGNLDPGLVQRWARDELTAFSGELVGANLLYDMDFLAEEPWGVKFDHVKAFHDVQVLEPLLDEWRQSYALDDISKDYLGEGKDEALLRQAAARRGAGDPKSLIWKMPAGYVGPYAEADVDRPLRILPLQLKRIEEENLGTVYTVERKLIPVLLAMRRRGVRVDVGRADEVRDQLSNIRDEALARMRHIAGPGAELMAPESFAHAFIERGINPPLTPKTKKPSITKGWLERNRRDELAKAIIDGRRVNSAITTFIDGHIKQHAIKGRIHCQFNQLKGDDSGTIARFSSSHPNLQQINARDKELAPLIRGLFLPDEGEQWGQWDYSQIEYRLLTHFAIGPGAEEARKKYRDDPSTDFHKYCAGMLGIDPDDDAMRKKVKGTNFCKVYGGGVSRIAETIGYTFEEAAEFNDRYDRELPFVKATLNAAMRWAERAGFVTDILGRRQRFTLWEPKGNRDRSISALPHARALAEYGTNIQRSMTFAALNRKNQASSASITKKAMVDSWEAGLQGVLGAPLITVHDENDSSVPLTKEGREAANETKRIMEQSVVLKVPVLVAEKFGPDWGHCK
jgi:DNA polymerase I-like protein with 3'-5' exonuclease and polymerase domains